MKNRRVLVWTMYVLKLAATLNPKPQNPKPWQQTSNLRLKKKQQPQDVLSIFGAANGLGFNKDLGVWG